MRRLHVRFRHDVFCPYSECGKRVCGKGDISQAIHPDGSPVSTKGFDALNPHAFEVACASHHVISLHFPKDMMMISTPPDSEGENRSPPAVLRL